MDTDVDENIFLDMDKATPLGIIINELVSNSFKHAFQGRDKGEIKIKLNRDRIRSQKGVPDIFTLIVSDNGVGIPTNLDIENLDSL
jgi:two-component sensor histidine kinase